MIPDNSLLTSSLRLLIILLIYIYIIFLISALINIMIYVFKPRSGHVIPPNSRKNPFGHFQEFRNMKNALLPPCPILLPLNWLILRQDKGKIPTKCMSGTPFLLISRSPLPYAHSMYGHVGRWAEVS